MSKQLESGLPNDEKENNSPEGKEKELIKENIVDRRDQLVSNLPQKSESGLQFSSEELEVMGISKNSINALQDKYGLSPDKIKRVIDLHLFYQTKLSTITKFLDAGKTFEQIDLIYKVRQSFIDRSHDVSLIMISKFIDRFPVPNINDGDLIASQLDQLFDEINDANFSSEGETYEFMGEFIRDLISQANKSNCSEFHTAFDILLEKKSVPASYQNEYEEFETTEDYYEKKHESRTKLLDIDDYYEQHSKAERAKYSGDKYKE